MHRVLWSLLLLGVLQAQQPVLLTLTDGDGALHVADLSAFPLLDTLGNTAIPGQYRNQLLAMGDTVVVVSSGDQALYRLVVDTTQHQTFRFRVVDTLALPTGSNPYAAVSLGSQLVVSLLLTDQIALVNPATGTYALTGTGKAPEGLALWGDLVLVAATAYDFGSYSYGQGMLYVHRISSGLQAVDSLPVCVNPQRIAVDSAAGIAAVLCTGDYGNTEGALVRVNLSTLQVLDTLPLPGYPTTVGFHGTQAFVGGYDASFATMAYRVDTTTGQTTPLNGVAGLVDVASVGADTLLMLVPGATWGGFGPGGGLRRARRQRGGQPCGGPRGRGPAGGPAAGGRGGSPGTPVENTDPPAPAGSHASSVPSGLHALATGGVHGQRPASGHLPRHGPGHPPTRPADGALPVPSAHRPAARTGAVLLVFPLIFLALPPAAAPGGAAADTLPPVVVIASPLPWPVDTFRSHVDTLALDLPDPRPLADRLDLLGGVWLPTYGTDASIRPVSLEGGRSRGTLLAIHGIPLPSLFGEGADLSLIPSSWVHGAALLRGGASGWYGPGAFQGVLNLDVRGTTGTGAGWSDRALWLQVAPGPVRIHAQLWPAMDPPGTWLALYVRPGPSVEGMWVERNLEPPAPLGLPGWRRQRERWGWGAFRTVVHRVHVEAFAEGLERRYIDRTLNLSSRHRALRIRLRLFRPVLGGWGLITLAHQPLESSEMGRHTLGELQLGWVYTRVAPFPLRSGVHLEIYRKDRRGTVLPSLRATTRWTVKGGVLFPEVFVSWNPPAPGDLFWSGDAFARGNPHLRPEGLGGTALTLRSSTWPLQCRVYAKLAHDLIVWTPDAHGQWRPRNLTRAHLYGAEMRWTTSTFQFSWSVLRNRDAEGNPLLYRPEHLGSVFLAPPPWRGIRPWLHLRYTGSRVRSAQPWDRLPPRLDLALGLVWRLSRGHIAVSMDHLLDRLWIPGYVDNRVGDLDGYPPPPRTLRVEWRASS